MEDSTASSMQRGRGLIVEPELSADAEELKSQFEDSLIQSQQDLVSVCGKISQDETASWQLASELITNFQPVPWFIWRLTNFVFSPGVKRDLPEGFVLGLRRLLFATASDELFGSGEKVNSLKESLKILSPEMVGSVSAIHSVCRKLSSKSLERFWRPALDEALLRSRIGYLTGLHQPDFGGGRGLLAGFVSRIGLAVLIASGDEERAQAVFEDVSIGNDLGQVSRQLYGCHPLHVGGMLLSAIGCGGNACFGLVAFLSANPLEIISNFEQRQWLASLTIIEAIRNDSISEVALDHWEVLNLDSSDRRDQLVKASRSYVRVDHGLHWLE
jgi:hypothetical protein